MQTNTFSETWEGFFVTFLVVLGTTVGFVLYLRKIKNQEAKEQQEHYRASGVFHNLNSDQQLLSLTEAQEQAKQGQLEQKDAFGTVGRGTSQMDIDRVVETLMRRASPDISTQRNSGTLTSNNTTTTNTSTPDASSTPPKNRSQVFTRAAPSDGSPTNTGLPSSPKTSRETNNKASETITPIGTEKSSASAKATASTAQPKENAANSSQSASQQPSNVKKMTAFWANPK